MVHGPIGGENRLNVAISRAKKKIYVITSFEPEELRVEISWIKEMAYWKNLVNWLVEWQGFGY